MTSLPWPVFECILGNTSEAIMLFDTDSRLTGANSVAANLMGVKRDALIGWPVEQITERLHAQSRVNPARTAELGTTRALQGQEVLDEPYTCCVPGKNEHATSVLVSAHPARGEHDEIMGVLVVLRDVTDISGLQQCVVDREFKSQVREFATGIIHDFKNVLTVIQQAVSLLEMPAADRPQDESIYFELIRTSLQRGVQLLQQWHDFTHQGAGEPGYIDLASLLHEVLDLLRPILKHEHVRLVPLLDPVDPVYCNPADLRRVFVNLALNAIQAMPQGGELRVTTAQQKGRVQVLISDTGKGISAEESKKLFQPYFTTKAGGTGLGLTIARRMLLASGGDISFRSQLDGGSCFVVELPGKREASAADGTSGRY